MRFVATFMLVILLVSGLWPGTSRPAVARQNDGDAAAQVAYELSVLEATGDFNALYDRIHPDAHAVIPRAAAVGWFQTDYAPRGPGVSTITGVRFVEWTWAVTGQTYPYTAEVSFDQPFADGSVLSDVVRLVQDGNGEWRWFFGRSREFVNEQIARFVQPVVHPVGASNVIDTAITDLNTFWSGSFGAAGRRYVTPGVVPFRREISTPCGRLTLDISPAAYCGLSMEIYYSPDWFARVDSGIGDFAWVTVLAHEWGHHVQTLEQTPRGPGSAFELQADCLAGTYARDAETRGWLDPGDLGEAVAISSAAGDPVGFPQDAEGAHGTGDDRISAFMRGYLDGFIGCSFLAGTSAGAPEPSERQPAQIGLFSIMPRTSDLPSDLVLVGDIERTLDEVVANYTDPVMAERFFVACDWRGNVARTYEGNGAASGVTSVYISIHELGSAGKARMSLIYSYGDQRRSTGAAELADPDLGAFSRAMVSGDEVTFLVQEGDMLIRLSVAVPGGDAEPVARDVMKAILRQMD